MLDRADDLTLIGEAADGRAAVELAPKRWAAPRMSSSPARWTWAAYMSRAVCSKQVARESSSLS